MDEQPNITGVILAAGLSTRMGTLKALLPFGGSTVIECVLRTYQPAVTDLWVVLGHQQQAIAALLNPEDAQIVRNDRYEEGMLSSVQCGVRAIQSTADAMLLGLVDQPLIRADTLHQTVQSYTPTRIVIPTHGGRRGHPVLIPAVFFDEILGLTRNDGGLRTLMRRYPEAVQELSVPDPGILHDLDTPEDYRAAGEAFAVELGASSR